MKQRIHQILAALPAALLLIPMAGCGYKTDPVPPQNVVPKAINDLRYSLDEKGARLTWSYPLETIAGENLTAIDSFELYRAEMPLKDFCSTCPIPFGEPIVLDGEEIPKDERKTKEYVSGLLRSGNKYFFKVRSRTSWWAASGYSNVVSFVYHTPPAAPRDVAAEIGANRVELSWSPVEELIDGSPVDLPLSYLVLKSEDGKNYSQATSAITGTSYVDNEVASGNTYFYKVESRLLFEDEVIKGTASPQVEASVVDLVPPPRVEGLTVVASMANIRVFWRQVSADDLAGYRIYRRIGEQGNFTRVGEVGAGQTIFIDADAPRERKVYYTVSGVDQQGNEGERSVITTSRH